MTARSARRQHSKYLREMGVPFIMRQSLAKTRYQGLMDDHYLSRKTQLVTTYYDSNGCDCCPPSKIQYWEVVVQKKTYRIQTEDGRIQSCLKF
jgi:hypothetical protein